MASLTWLDPPEHPYLLQQVMREWNMHPAMAQVLISRGLRSLSEMHAFLYGQLPELHDPWLFLEMPLAVRRIQTALALKQSILIYGDSDVDGMTATALLVDFLRRVGGCVQFALPPFGRKNLTQHLLSCAIESRAALLITVDCGITAAEEIEALIRHQVDVIVTDHHEPTAQIPHCVATLNPKLQGSLYPNRALTGVGVAFKLVHALAKEFTERGSLPMDLKEYLDLVALGTVADMGSLMGENRILVRYGLKEMSHRKRVGLSKLFQVARLSIESVTSLQLSLKIAPRLNSLGRVADPRKGVELLLTQDEAVASRLALELDLSNEKRQHIEREAMKDLDERLTQDPDLLFRPAIALDSTLWHPGIVAILSAKLAKRYYRPTLVISVENGVGKGSLRTIPAFPLLAFLKANEELLMNFGGHNFAAGITILEENIPLFKERFLQEAQHVLGHEQLVPRIQLDAKLDFVDMTADLMESLALLEPFGVDNPVPLFYSRALSLLDVSPMRMQHLKLRLLQEGRTLEGIGFGWGDRYHEIANKRGRLSAAFTLAYRASSILQLHIKAVNF